MTSSTTRQAPSMATCLTAAALATLCTAAQLFGVAAIAEHQRSAAAAHAPQIVQLERVVVSAKRIAAAPKAGAVLRTAACDSLDAQRC